MTLLVGIGIIILWVYVLYVGVFIPGLINEKLPKIDEVRNKARRNLLNPKYQIWDQNRS